MPTIIMCAVFCLIIKISLFLNLAYINWFVSFFEILKNSLKFWYFWILNESYETKKQKISIIKIV